MAQAPAPARLIEGGLPTDATVAQVLVSKYADHLPLYRQAQIFARQGVNLDRSTLADWVGRAALLLEPVHGWLLDYLKASTKLIADETTAPVLDPGRGRTKTGQLWAYARNDRPWGGADPPAVAYVYAPDRKAERPMAHLAGFTGVLQVDGYEGYRALTKGGAVKLAFCWSHVRRGFIDLAAKGASPIAAEVLTRIAALYRIEGEIAGLPAEARSRAREERSRPLLSALERFLGDKLALLSQKSTLAVAIRYATSRWAGLTLYVEDGRVEMDSNTVERSIRPLATAVSLCIPLSSVCKHWKRARILDATRATFPGHRAPDRLRRQIGCPDLMGGARNNLNRRQHASFDEAPYRVVRDARNPRRLGHREPFPILFRRSVSMDAAHASDGGDPVRRPGFTLSSRQAHPVERRGDMLVRPAARHAPHDRQGILGRRATVFPASRLVHAQLRVLAATPVDREHDVTHCLVDVDHDVGDQCPQELLPSPRRHTRRLPCRRQVVGQGGEDVQIGHAVR